MMHVINHSAFGVAALFLLLLAAGFELPLNPSAMAGPGTALMQGVSAGLLLLLLASVLQSGRGPRIAFWIGLLLLVGLPALYLLNASHIWRDGTGLVPVAHWRWLPATAYPAGTLTAIWLGLGVAAALGLAVRLSARGRDVLIGLIVAVGAIMAGVVLYQRYEPRPFPVYPWTGLFVNRNHFAAFACLVYPVAIVSGIRLQIRAYRQGRLSSPAGLVYVTAGLMAFAAFKTDSRAGLVIIILQTLGLGLLLGPHLLTAGMHRVGLFHRFRRIWLSLLVLMLGIGGYAIARVGAFGRVVGDLAFRGALWRDTLDMWQSRPVWGTGPGTFEAVIPYYQSDAIAALYFRHAHNDPLQFLSEFGGLGGGLTLIGVVLLLWGARRRKAGSESDHESDEWWPAGLLAGLTGVLLHGLVDFPFQHPLILLLVCVWLGILAGTRFPQRERESTSRP